MKFQVFSPINNTSEMLKHCGASVSERCGFPTTELPALLYPLLYAFEPVLPFLEVFHGVPLVLVYPSLCAYSGVVPFPP